LFPARELKAGLDCAVRRRTWARSDIRKIVNEWMGGEPLRWIFNGQRVADEGRRKMKMARVAGWVRFAGRILIVGKKGRGSVERDKSATARSNDFRNVILRIDLGRKGVAFRT
jgi:hypothetical protein